MVPNFQRLLSLYMTGQFGKFLVAGGLAAVANFASRFAFERSFSFWAAVSLAYIVGFATAFTLNRLFVFPASDKPLHHEIGWFFSSISSPSRLSSARLRPRCAVRALRARFLRAVGGARRRNHAAGLRQFRRAQIHHLRKQGRAGDRPSGNS